MVERTTRVKEQFIQQTMKPYLLYPACIPDDINKNGKIPFYPQLILTVFVRCLAITSVYSAAIANC